MSDTTAPAPPPDSHRPQQPARVNPLATWSLVLALINVFGITSLIGTILGFVALRQIRLRSERGRGVAIAGIVVGLVLFLLTTILGIVLAVASLTSG